MVDALFFPVEHVLDEYKSQAMKAMKEPMLDDHVHKKLSSAFMNNIKLQKMQEALTITALVGTFLNFRSARLPVVGLWEQNAFQFFHP